MNNSTDLALAYQFFENKQFLESQELLLQIVKHDSDNHSAFFLLAQVFDAIQQTEKSIELTLELIRINPNNQEYRDFLNKIQNPNPHQYDTPDIPNHFKPQEAALLDSNLNTLGELEFEKGNQEQAKLYFEEAISQKQQADLAWNNLGVVNSINKQYYEAEKCFLNALLINQNLNNARFNLKDTIDLILSDKPQLSKSSTTIEKNTSRLQEVTSTYHINNSKKRIVQFYILKNVHWGMFKELFFYLENREDIEEIIFCIPNLTMLTGNEPQDDFIREVLERENVKYCRNPRTYPTDITFIADSFGGKLKGCGKVVAIGHGTISKGFYFTDSIWTGRENLADLICVPGPFAQEILSPQLNIPVIETGMPKLDPAFQKKYKKEKLCQKIGADSNRPLVLYAPTFNRVLSANYYIADDLPQLTGDGTQILIKLHGFSTAEFLIKFKQMASDFQDIFFIEDLDITPWLSISDVIISDVSSTMMEFMCLNKPVVLFDSPDWQKYHGYNPEEIEYKWRDFAHCSSSIAGIKEGVTQALQNPTQLAHKRDYYGHRLMGETRGKACQKTWEACQNLLNNKWSSQNKPLFSVVIPIDENEEFNENQLYLSSTQSAVAIEIIFVVHTQNEHIDKLVSFSKNLGFYNVKIITQEFSETWNSFKIGADQASGDYIVYQNIWAQVFRNPYYFAEQILSKNSKTDVLWPSDTQETSHLFWKNQTNGDTLHEEDLEQVAFKLIREQKLSISDTTPKEDPIFFIIKTDQWSKIKDSTHWLEEFKSLKHSRANGILIQQPSKNSVESLKRLIPVLISTPEKLDFSILSEALQSINSDSLNTIIGNRLLGFGQQDSALKVFMSSIPNDYIGEWGALDKCIQILKSNNSPIPHNLSELSIISSKLNKKFNSNSVLNKT